MKFIQPFFILLLLANGLQAQNCSTFDISAASSASTILCGGNATLTASPTNSQSLTVSYSWSPGGSTQPSLVVSPKTNTTYTVLATRSDGCTKSKTVSVAVTPFDITLVSNTSSIVCGGSATLTATPTLATSFPISYTWSPITSNQSSVVVNPKSTTVYSVTATHSGSCTSQKSVTVTVNNNISITQSNPSSLQPWLTSGSRMNLTITGLNNPVWSENEAHIVLVNPSSATVTVRSNVSPSTVMPNSTVTVSGSNVSPGCPTSASTTVFGINANFFPNGLITNCDGNNTKVLTAVLPFAGVQNYRFDWYKITNSSPVFVSSGNTLSVTKTGSGLAVGNARYFPQVVPINTSFPIAGNQSSVLADIKFSTQPTPVTQGTSPQNAILLDICVPVTVDNLCYANTYQPTLNINPSGDVYFYIVGAPVLPGFSPTGVEQTVGYDFEMCSKFNLPSALILPGDLATGDSFSTIHDNNTDNNPNLCKRGNYINPIMRRGRRYEIVVEGVANNRGPFTVKYTGVTGRPECSNFRKGTVNASNIIENTELNATIVANPLTTSIDITLPSADISKVSIVNLQGQEVKSLEMNTSSAQIPVAELSNGIYLVNVHQNGQLFNAKVNISK